MTADGVEAERKTSRRSERAKSGASEPAPALRERRPLDRALAFASVKATATVRSSEVPKYLETIRCWGRRRRGRRCPRLRLLVRHKLRHGQVQQKQSQ